MTMTIQYLIRACSLLSFTLLTPMAPANSLLEYADPFYGNAGVDLPPPVGIAAAWNWKKAQTGNTHAGAQLPFGMVSVVPYTKAYPTGAGYNKKTTKGRPRYDAKLKDAAFGFTHFQQSGTGAILSYYNFLRLMPLSGYNTENREKLVKLKDVHANPGYYGCVIEDTGIKVEMTTSHKVAYHRYEIPEDLDQARLMVELTSGGIGSEREKVFNLSAKKTGANRIEGQFTDQGFPYFYVMELSSASGLSFYGDGNPKIEVSEEEALMKANKIKRKPEPFYVDGVFDIEGLSTVEVKVAFSFRSIEQAKENLQAAPADFAAARTAAETAWEETLAKIPYTAPDERSKKLFYSNLYHTLVKPSICLNESPWWDDAPFTTDFSTLWDIYKTQLPLIIKYYPEQGTQILQSMILAMETHGEFPCGYMKTDEKRFDRFRDQATGIEWPVFAYAYREKLSGIDWKRVLKLADGFAAQERVKELSETGAIEGLSLTHTLDVASAFAAICYLAKGEGDSATFERFAPKREIWRKAYDPSTGLLKEGKYYEGTHWNYSFRPHYAMEERVKLAGGKEAFTKLLEEFFGFTDVEKGEVNANPGDGFERNQRSNRFEGLNNECDMESPFAYRWSTKPERTQEIVDAVMKYQFAPGPHGLPGNNDSGGTSSWWVWNALGDFPLVEVFE
jgi:predicted alpha-1,2-mannosidase